MFLPYDLTKLKDSINKSVEDAKEKSEKFIEVSKVNLEILNKEKEITDLYAELGKKIYRKYDKNKTFDSSIIEEKCKEIKKIKDEIKELKKNVLKLQNKKLCPVCENEVDKHSSYCKHCGFKQS